MKGQETRGFQSEVKQLLHLMIHSLYSNKEIFLRELISNASDAADKLRFRALSNPDLYEGDGELRVRVSFDKDKRTLTISDNGVGMTRDEVIDHLGTIAKSGTKSFLESLGSDQAKDSQLIGQFGVGFYSAFIVADKVTVRTRAAGEKPENGVFWESAGEGEYTVADITKEDRGTEITLHLREGEDEFLDDWRVRSIISKYSDHIALPVEIEKREEKDGETVISWEKINKAQALWTRNKSEIADQGFDSLQEMVGLAKLANAPFIKVEATKFTEVGYVGKEVDSIIRDLTDAAVKMVRVQAIEKNRYRAEELAEERILDVLIPPAKNNWGQTEQQQEPSAARQAFRKKLREGQLDDKEIEIDLAAAPMGVEIMAPPGMEEMTSQLQSMFQNLGGQKQKARKLKIKDAMKLLIEEEAAKLVNPEELKQDAIDAVEQHGIVFIDEIDKICKRGESSGPDVSREGVQRDLLPLVEGCTVSTKHGMVKTDHILFIASGAFQIAKPSDLIPELQGRLPIRVELQALTTSDFERILTEPNASITVQYKALMATEGVNIEFTDSGIKRIAEAAWQVNESTENIGARRLHTVLERLMEEISYDASDLSGQTIIIDADYVSKHLDALVADEDLSRFIL